jgi:hypothetical protein
MSETAETAPPLSLDADSSNDSILEQFDNFSEALTAATLVLTVDVNTQHLECKIIALEKEKQKLKAEIYDTKAVASAELSVLETEKRHVIETLHETFDLKTGLLEQQCATLRMELFKCKTERNSNRESCAHVQDGEAPTASAASTVQADIRLLEAQLVQRSAALEELKKVTDVRVGNATEAHRAATEKADALHAGLTGLTTEIIAAEDLFKSLYGTAWTATLRSSYKPRRKDNSAAVVLRALIQLSADRLASLSATQPVSSSSKASSSNALCAGAVSRAELVAPVANRASDGRPASAVPHSSSNTSTALAPHTEINHIRTISTGVTNNGPSRRGVSGPFTTLGRAHFASILVGPHSQFWLARDTILGVASTIGQVVSTFPVGQSWKVTYASNAVARKALTEVNWVQMYPAASRQPGRLDCRPYREASVPVLQRCVYVTFPVAKYVPTGDGLAQALSTLGDVLAVFQIPAGFCVEFSAQATAQAVLQSFRANGAVVIPLCEEHVRPLLLQLRSSGDRTGEFHFLARSPHDRDTHSLAAWFRTAYCSWACDSLATAASRMAMLSEYAQFCTVTVTATKEPISTERVKRLACMVGEDSSSNEDGGRIRRGGPVAIDDDDSEVSDGADINESAQTASQHRSQPVRETVSRKVVQQLKDQVVSLKAQLYDVGKRESQWQSETKNVKNKYRQKIAQLQSRVVELESSQARNSSSDANAATHEAAVSTENQQLEQLLQLERRESQVSREKTAELQTELQHMSSQNKAVSQKYTSLTNQLNNVKAHLKEARAETDKLKGELESAHAQAADAAQRSTSPPPQRVDKQQASGAPGSPAQAQAQEELTRRYAKVQKQLELREERLEELEAELQAAHAATTLRERHVKELELKVSDAEFQTEAQVRGLSVHTEELNESLRDAEERVRNLADINMKKGYDIADLQNAVRGWEERCARQSAELRDLRASDAHLDQRVRDLAARARAGEEDCRRLQDKLTERDGHISALQRDIDRKSRAIHDQRRAATIPAEADNPASGAGPSQEAYAQLLAMKDKVSKGFQPLPDRLLSAKQAVAVSSAQQDPLSLPSLNNLLDKVEATAAAVNGAIRGGFPDAGLLRSLCGVTDAGGNPQMQAFALVAGYYVYHANHTAVEAAEKDLAIDAILAEVAAIPGAQQHATTATLEGARSGAGAGDQVLHGTGAQSPDDGTACSEMSLGSGDDLQPPAKQPRLQLELPQAVQDTTRDPRLVKLRASPTSTTSPPASDAANAALLKPVAVAAAAAEEARAAVVSPAATLGKRQHSEDSSETPPRFTVRICGPESDERVRSIAERCGPVRLIYFESDSRYLVEYERAQSAEMAVYALGRTRLVPGEYITCSFYHHPMIETMDEPCMVLLRHRTMSPDMLRDELARVTEVKVWLSVGDGCLATAGSEASARSAANTLNCAFVAGATLSCKHIPSLPAADRARLSEAIALLIAMRGRRPPTHSTVEAVATDVASSSNQTVDRPDSEPKPVVGNLTVPVMRGLAPRSVMIRHQTLLSYQLVVLLCTFGEVIRVYPVEDRTLVSFADESSAVDAARSLHAAFKDGKAITCRYFPTLPLKEKVELMPGYTELERPPADSAMSDRARFTARGQPVHAARHFERTDSRDRSTSRSASCERPQHSSTKSSWRDPSPPHGSAVRTVIAPQTVTFAGAAPVLSRSTTASSVGSSGIPSAAKPGKRYCTTCAERGVVKAQYSHNTEDHRDLFCAVCTDLGLGSVAFTHSTENHRSKTNPQRPRSVAALTEAAVSASSASGKKGVKPRESGSETPSNETYHCVARPLIAKR